MANLRSHRTLILCATLLVAHIVGGVAGAQVIRRDALKPYPYQSELFYATVSPREQDHADAEPVDLNGMYRDGKEYVFYGCAPDASKVFFYRPSDTEPGGLSTSSFTIPNQHVGHVIIKRINGKDPKFNGLRVIVMGDYQLSIHTIDGEQVYSVKTARPYTSGQIWTTADPEDTWVYFLDKRDGKEGTWGIDLDTDGDPVHCFMPGTRHQDPKSFGRIVEFHTGWTAEGDAVPRAQVISSTDDQRSISRLHIPGRYYKNSFIRPKYHRVCAVLPGTDLAAGFSLNHGLELLSVYGQRRHKGINVSALRSRRSNRMVCYGDPQNDQFIVVGANGILFVPYATFGIKPNEQFVVGGDFPDKLLTRREVQIPLTKFDPGDRFELENEPSGMSLQDNKIVYTPDIDAAGNYEVTVSCLREKRKTEFLWNFDVKLPKMQLEFAPVEVRVTPNGRYAVLSSDPATQSGERYLSRLTTVDLTAAKVIADQQLNPPLSQFDVTNSHVFCTTSDSVARYRVQDLGLDGQGGQILKYPVERFRVLGDSRMVVSFPRHPAIHVDQRSLRVVPTIDEQIKPTEFDTAFGFMDSGMLLDPATARPRLLIRPIQFLTAAEDQANESRDRWHPFYPATLADRHVGYPAYAIPAKSLSTAIPLVRMAKAFGNVCVETIAPETGELIGTYPLLPIEELGEIPFGDFQCGANVVVVQRGQELYILPVGELGLEKPPFHIVPQQDQFIVAEGKLALQYQAPGATQFRISSPAIESLQQPKTSDSGSFEIDLSLKSKLVWRQGLTELEAIQPKARAPQSQRLSAIFKQQQRAAKRWFGQDIGQLLLPIRFRVESDNAAGETAILDHFVLLRADPKHSVEILRFFESQPNASK